MSLALREHEAARLVGLSLAEPRLRFAFSLAATLLSFVAAGLATRMDPLGVLALACGSISLVAAFARPFAGALAVVALTTAIPRDTLFAFGLPPGGGIKVTDVLIGASLGGYLWAKTRGAIPARPLPRHLVLSIAALISALLMGALTARLADTRANDIVLEARPLLAYLLVFPIVSGLSTHHRRVQLLTVLLAASSVAALTAIYQYFAGDGVAVLFAGDALRVDDAVYTGLLGAALLSAIVALFVESLLARWLLLGCLALNATGLFFTFRRGAWIAGLLALAVALLLLSPTAKVRAGRVLVLGLVLASIAVLTTGDGSAQGSVLGSGASRIESIGAYSDDVSAQHRLAEWRAAASEYVPAQSKASVWARRSPSRAPATRLHTISTASPGRPSTFITAPFGTG